MANSTSHFIGCNLSSVVSKIDVLIFISISLASVVGHTIILVAYSRHRVLRSTTNVFLISLSVSDVIVAVLSVPFSFGVFLCHLLPNEDKSTIYNYIYRHIDMLSSVVSIYSLSLISIDRAVAVVFPFYYRKYMNQKAALTAVVIIWIVISAAVFLQLVLTLKQFTLLSIIMAYAIPVAVMISSYTAIGYAAKKHAKEINQLDRTATRLHRSMTSNESCRSYSLVQEENAEERTFWKTEVRIQSQHFIAYKSFKSLPGVKMAPQNLNMKCMWREVKCAVKLSFILLCFVVSWTPFMVLNMMQHRCNFCSGIDMQVVKYFKLLHYSNSALNPLLYILLNKTWKKAFKATLCCGTITKERRSTFNSSVTSRNW